MFHVENGHFAFDKLIEVLKRYVWWPTMKPDAKKFVDQCVVCQKNKVVTQNPIGLIKPLPLPTENFESLGLDFILGLPRNP